MLELGIARGYRAPCPQVQHVRKLATTAEVVFLALESIREILIVGKSRNNLESLIEK
jgi:hypothetical protein